MKKSIDKLILEPYKGSGKIESGITSGFATVKQKTNLVGLKVIEDAKIQRGNLVFDIKKNSTVYFTEEVLHSSPWAKRTFQCSSIDGNFIIAEPTQVVLINESQEA